MKREVLFIQLLVIAVFSFLIIGCKKEEDSTTKKFTCPLYSDVLKDMKQCGCQEVSSKGLDIESLMSPNYVAYSVFYNQKTDNYYVPVCYDSNDQKSLDMAMGTCNHIYSETVITKNDGTKEININCEGEGNSCHYEIALDPSFRPYVFIVTCDKTSKKSR